MKRWAALLLVVLCALIPFAACAEETAEIVGPTRDPNAPEYSTEYPEDLKRNQIVANCFVLMDAKTGEILWEVNGDVLRPPASTTKIMTALLALRFGNLEDMVTMTESAMNIPSDASKVPFKLGEVMTLENALYGLLLRSGNEAANAIAEYVAGDNATFVERMNDLAALLGCTNTHFMNPDGYDQELHLTTARDLAVMFRAALQDETFRKIIKTASYRLPETEMSPARDIQNLNLHIQSGSKYPYKYSIGGKTGSTSGAGYCLVEAAEKDGVTLIAVILNSNQYARWPDTSRLFEYGFTLYKSVTPEEIYNVNMKPIVANIQGFDLESERAPRDENGNIKTDTESENTSLGRLVLAIEAVDPTRKVSIADKKEVVDSIIENFSSRYINIQMTSNMRAPITAGQQMGTLTFYPPGEQEAEYKLIATRSIKARDNAPPSLEELEQRAAEDPSIFPPLSVDWMLPPIAILLAIVLGIRALIKQIKKRRTRRRRVPKPKRRSYG